MIRLENFELEILNLHNEIDNSFFNKMNNEEQFKEYFGKVIYNENNSDNIFMKNYLVNYNITLILIIEIEVWQQI